MANEYGSTNYGEGYYGDGEITPNPQGDIVWIFEVKWGDSWVNEARRLVYPVQSRRGRKYLIDPGGAAFEPIQPGQITVTLENKNDRYNPWNSSSPLYGNIKPGRLVRLIAKERESGTKHTLFTGRLVDIKPVTGLEKQVQLIAMDDLRYLEEQTVSIAAGKTDIAGAISAVLDAADFPAGSTIQACMQPVYFFNPDNRNALTTIRELADASAGTFFVSRGGTARYYDRTYDSQASHTLTQDLLLKDIRVAMPWETIRNHVTVYANRRGYTASAVVWQTATPIAVPALTVKYIDISFPEGTVSQPIPGYGFAANQNPDGSGYNYTWMCGCTLTDITPTTARIRLVNLFTSATIYFLWIKIYGKLLVSDKVYSAAEDSTSIADYGRKAFTLDNEWLQDKGYADGLSAILLDFLKDPQENPVVQIQGRPTLQYDFDLFDKVVLDIDALSIDETFYIGMIEHEWQNDTGQDVLTTLHLQKILLDDTEITPDPFYPGVPDIPDIPDTPDPGDIDGGDDDGDSGLLCADNVDAPRVGPVELGMSKVQLSGEDAEETDRTSTTLYPCIVRMDAAVTGTFLHIQGAFGRWYEGYWYEDADASDWIHAYAIDAEGNAILTGVVSKEPNGAGYIATFEPSGPLTVAGFKIVIDQDEEWVESGSGTLTQDTEWGDPAGGTRLWGEFPGDFSIVNTGGNRYNCLGWELDCGDLSLPAGQLICTFDCSYSVSPEALGFSVFGYGDNPLGGVHGSGIYWGEGEMVYICAAQNFVTPGKFAISIGWFGDWSTTAVLTKLQWAISGGETVDLWDATLTTGNLAGLARVDLYNYCAVE
jgi:hypothetical protein